MSVSFLSSFSWMDGRRKEGSSLASLRAALLAQRRRDASGKISSFLARLDASLVQTYRTPKALELNVLTKPSPLQQHQQQHPSQPHRPPRAEPRKQRVPETISTSSVLSPEPTSVAATAPGVERTDSSIGVSGDFSERSRIMTNGNCTLSNSVITTSGYRRRRSLESVEQPVDAHELPPIPIPSRPLRPRSSYGLSSEHGAARSAAPGVGARSQVAIDSIVASEAASDFAHSERPRPQKSSCFLRTNQHPRLHHEQQQRRPWSAALLRTHAANAQLKTSPARAPTLLPQNKNSNAKDDAGRTVLSELRSGPTSCNPPTGSDSPTRGAKTCHADRPPIAAVASVSPAVQRNESVAFLPSDRAQCQDALLTIRRFSSTLKETYGLGHARGTAMTAAAAAGDLRQGERVVAIIADDAQTPMRMSTSTTSELALREYEGGPCGADESKRDASVASAASPAAPPVLGQPPSSLSPSLPPSLPGLCALVDLLELERGRTLREPGIELQLRSQEEQQPTLVEIGAGDARLVCCAASRVAGCRAVGVELRPKMLLAAKQRIDRAGLAHRVEMLKSDARLVDYSRATCIFMYLSPAALAIVAPSIERTACAGTTVFTYVHAVPNWKSAPSTATTEHNDKLSRASQTPEDATRRNNEDSTAVGSSTVALRGMVHRYIIGSHREKGSTP